MSGNKLTNFVVANKVLNSNPVVVMDIGAKGGVEPIWSQLQDQIRFVCLEPDAEYCKIVNQDPRFQNQRFYPVAASNSKGAAKLNVSRNGYGSSMLETNTGFVNKFPQSHLGQIVRQIDIQTTDLDSFCRENNFGNLDFIKLDVEGAELLVLDGAKEIIRNSVIGLNVEVFFHEYHKGRPLFGEVDAYMRSIGFHLFDFLSTEKWCRKTLAKEDLNTWYGYGQLMWGNALYLRNLTSSKNRPEGAHQQFDKAKYLKAAIISEMYDKKDYSIEIVRKAKEVGVFSPEEAHLCENLLQI